MHRKDSRLTLQWGPKIVEDLQQLVDDLYTAIENAPCEVASLGELSYECRHDKLCRVCSWRNETFEMMKSYEAWRPNQVE